jgi:hypothetical protein
LIPAGTHPPEATTAQEKKKAARQFAVRPQSSLRVTVFGNRELKGLGGDQRAGRHIAL